MPEKLATTILFFYFRETYMGFKRLIHVLSGESRNKLTIILVIRLLSVDGGNDMFLTSETDHIPPPLKFLALITLLFLFENRSYVCQN